jgi:hypothetical protein
LATSASSTTTVSFSWRVTSTAPVCSHSNWVRGILPSVVSGDLLKAGQESSGPL